MNCIDREQLFALAHRMLDAGEEAAARAHVAECERCRQAVEEYARLDAVLDEWKPTGPSPWFDVRVRAAVAVEGEGGWRKNLAAMQWARWLVPAAAVAALVFWLVVMRLSPPSRPVARETPPVQKTAPAPEVRQKSSPVVRAQTSSPPAGAVTLAPTDETTPEDDLKTLDDYDMLANFDILSELPRGEARVVN